MRNSRRLVCAGLLVCLVLGADSAGAYSVLTHEQIVDMVWLDQLRPMILQRFPGLTEDQLRQAHAYAYGGAVIQDLGYYPYGSKQFSDLVHYVRSGDFVVELLRESLDANEYAFALGALAHYCSDMYGHPAVNVSTGVEYPQLKAEFGPVVTYEDKPIAHLRTEIGFDMVQVAKQRYTSRQYHDFIGFMVPESLLERVFPAIYGLPLLDVLPHEEKTIGSYRWAISRAIPKLTDVALATHKAQIMKEAPTFNRQEFLYHLSRAQYERDWGNSYERPGFGARVLAFVLRIMPHVGPFKAVAYRNPTPQTEDLYFKSVNTTVEHYKAMLAEVRSNTLHLANVDLDTGKPTLPGEYRLADSAYATLVHELALAKMALSDGLRANIVQFYSNSNANLDTRRRPEDFERLQTELAPIRAGKQ